MYDLARATKMRWLAFALCGAGILIGVTLMATSARTAECSGQRADASRAADAVKITACNQKSKSLKSVKANKSAKKLATKPRSKKDTRLARAKANMLAKNLRATKSLRVYKALHVSKARQARLRVFSAGRPLPTGVGAPYVIAGRTYVPQADRNYRAEGRASWYGDSFHGRRTANGETFDMHALTAAHPTLPLQSYVRVTNLENNTSLIVRVNDRGPFSGGRLIDLSVRAAKLLGFYDQGIAKVRVEYIGRAESAGSNDEMLAATLRRENTVQVATNAPSHPSVPRSKDSASRTSQK